MPGTWVPGHLSTYPTDQYESFALTLYWQPARDVLVPSALFLITALLSFCFPTPSFWSSCFSLSTCSSSSQISRPVILLPSREPTSHPFKASPSLSTVSILRHPRTGVHRSSRKREEERKRKSGRTSTFRVTSLHLLQPAAVATPESAHACQPGPVRASSALRAALQLLAILPEHATTRDHLLLPARPCQLASAAAGPWVGQASAKSISFDIYTVYKSYRISESLIILLLLDSALAFTSPAFPLPTTLLDHFSTPLLEAVRGPVWPLPTRLFSTAALLTQK
ncbi:hypothetical protein BD289DRAFT_122506 [Coniella lustricola]|uniref:Uncharacterized protein n=1 Tax=Coniella lustricola TaxID=2025994 RepID=A0A2T2ZWH0_9PEZI|nr:hypothetical protein BD289DRAFT_122506 [Coniella lustricola]